MRDWSRRLAAREHWTARGVDLSCARDGLCDIVLVEYHLVVPIGGFGHMQMSPTIHIGNNSLMTSPPVHSPSSKHKLPCLVFIWTSPNRLVLPKGLLPFSLAVLALALEGGYVDDGGTLQAEDRPWTSPLFASRLTYV